MLEKKQTNSWITYDFGRKFGIKTKKNRRLAKTAGNFEKKSHITFSLNVSADQCINALPVDAGDHRDDQEWEDDAPVAHNSAEDVNGVPDHEQNPERKKYAEEEEGRLVIRFFSPHQECEKKKEDDADLGCGGERQQVTHIAGIRSQQTQGK